jgi:hypothetical protein
MVRATGRGWALAVAVAVAACGGAEFSSDNGGGGAGGSASTSAGGASSVAVTDAVASSTSGGGTSSGGGGGASAGGASVGGASVGGSGGEGGGAIDAAIRDAPTETSTGRDVATPDVKDAASSDVIAVTQCPPVEPSAAGACTDGLVCTYGTHPRLACRKQYNCTSGHWAPTPGLACPTLGDCNNEQPLPVIGAMCPVLEHDCLWSSGLYCRCRASGDAGGGAWDCYPSPSNCPTTPPNRGQACDPSAQTCSYGTCGLGTKVTTSCSGGVVSWTSTTCP